MMKAIDPLRNHRFSRSIGNALRRRKMSSPANKPAEAAEQTTDEKAAEVDITTNN